MHRFYLPPQQCRGDTLFLTRSEAHHALHVVRVRPNEDIVVLDGEGRQLACRVIKCGSGQVELKVAETALAPPPACQLTLLQGVPKGKLIESIIQKATELGAARVVPLLAERTVIRLEEQERRLKAAKWQAIAIESIKQCGSPWLTRVEEPLGVPEYLQRREGFELALVGSLQERRRHPREYFEIFRRVNGRNPKTAGIWIGPEGDFTPRELQLIQDSGAFPVNLGPLVLRTETAAIYSLAILNYEVQAGD